MKELKADLVIIGGSLGGCAAAMSALENGLEVILTEETDWIGGQITSQGVPPDEHPWIEMFGSTRRYRRFRNDVRDFYATYYPLAGPRGEEFNPGNALVSKIAHEPKVALAVLEHRLAPYLHSGKLKLLLNTEAVKVETKGDEIEAVEVVTKEGKKVVLTAPYFIDATDEGSLLPLAGVEYTIGRESQGETGERHAAPGASDPMDMQAFTYCFAMDYLPNEDHTIEKPEQYDFWREYQAPFWPDKQLSWAGVVPHTLEPLVYDFFPSSNRFNLWTYRRIIDKSQFAPGLYESDLTVVNWPQNDYWLGPIIDVSPEEREKHLHASKQLSLSLLYWMQTEAPRPDGGVGYPGLRLRKDVFDTEDGLAKAPYIRESRRIKALFTILEKHVNTEDRQGEPIRFPDSVGVGSYRVDLHPTTGLRHYVDFSSVPFEIPLGAFLPIRVKNLIPACKNIGTTHITNGCYRLHPVEWNIGEVAGLFLNFCLQESLTPHEVYENREHLEEFQRFLDKEGVQRSWPRIHPV
ncbi:MAG: FAD-dependent oxidoreductase [Firmicutes bacterium]|nr:FAD-dependent oxidoreductase [Bacillota bacterium]